MSPQARVVVPGPAGFEQVDVELVEHADGAWTARADCDLPTGTSLGLLLEGEPAHLVRRQRLPHEPDGEYHLREVPPDELDA